MDIQERRKFYQSIYFYELDMRDKIYMKSRLPVAILVVMIPVNIFLIKGIYTASGFVFSFSWFLGVLSLLLLGRLMYYIHRGIVGWEYSVVPLEKIEEYFDALKTHYEEYYKTYYKEHSIPTDKQEPIKIARRTFEKNLVEQFLEFSLTNQRNNQERSACITRFFKLLPFYFLVLVILYFIS